MPRSSTPADPRTQATTGPAMWSSVRLTTSTPRLPLSRLNHAACTLSVYASQPGSPPDHATLDSGWWPALTGQDFHLLGRVEGFRHVYPSTWLPPSPSFAWRNKRSFRPWRRSSGSWHAYSGRRKILTIEGALPVPSKGPEPDVLFRLVVLFVPLVAPAPLGGSDSVASAEISSSRTAMRSTIAHV